MWVHDVQCEDTCHCMHVKVSRKFVKIILSNFTWVLGIEVSCQVCVVQQAFLLTKPSHYSPRALLQR